MVNRKRSAFWENLPWKRQERRRPQESGQPQQIVNVFDSQINIANDEGKIYASMDLGRENAAYGKRVKFQNNKKEKYVENWNSRLFLHLNNSENPLTLADAFIMPDCGYRMTHGGESFSSNDGAGDLINKFLKYENTSDLLIAGVPGSGKSTITSWIANQYSDNKNCIILRFRDWEEEELENGLLKAICTTLECKKRDLEGKILVLDGFDEMKLLDIREKILARYLNDIKDLEKFKCIITSRIAYVESNWFCNRITILPFDMERIKLFYQKITGTPLTGEVTDKESLGVLGVPVILYMAIMSNIDITQNTSKPELYNRIFAEKAGIFDRFSEYDSGAQILRNPQNVKKHLKFLREIAFMMFEKNDLQIRKTECDIPELEYCGKQVSILEFPIQHLFENTNPNIEFIHSSIYEYFVSEYVFLAITEAAGIGVDTESLAGALGKILKRNRLSGEIVEFLKYRIHNSKCGRLFETLGDAFQLMLRDGMTYYTNERYKNANVCERNVFLNMLEIIHFWEFDSWEADANIRDYLQYNINNLNLRKFDLKNVDLSDIHLYGPDLQGSDLSRTSSSTGKKIINRLSLQNANLRDSKLKNVVMKNVNLEGADLNGADFSGSDLRGANLANAAMENVILNEAIIDARQIGYFRKKDLLGGKVYVPENKKVMSYEEYSRRQREKDLKMLETSPK